ncbi:hypothetical protein [Streptomyces sp. NPDC002845]
MSGPRFRRRRTTLSRARGRWARLFLALLVGSATFALFCVSAPPARAAEPSAVTSTSAVTPAPRAPSATADERLDAGVPQHADRDPCEKGPRDHHCHGAQRHHGVLGHTPLFGADRACAPGQPPAAPARAALAPSREPGAARPPDLHELQLLRV